MHENQKGINEIETDRAFVKDWWYNTVQNKTSGELHT